MTIDLIPQIKATKKASKALAQLTDAQRNDLLRDLAEQLRERTKIILGENAKDVALMDSTDPMVDRLLLTTDRIKAIADSIDIITTLPTPLGQTLSRYTRSDGLIIEKNSVPLGVVAVIYESRPNVTIDVFSLCFKAGNACILKGGKEAIHTNTCLVGIIKETLRKAGLSEDIVFSMPSDREAMKVLFEAQGLVDVCIPRGSHALIQFVREHAKIPVIETGAGIVHTYFDEHGDIEKGIQIIENAKTRRVSVCNALDCLLVHKDRLKELPTLLSSLGKKNVELFADDTSYETLKSTYPISLLHKAQSEDYGREFLSLKMAVKTVNSLEEAIAHICEFTSGHSEAIITEDAKTAHQFVQSVDAAAVYVNASTAFTDGGEFGMGAEIGNSTQKLHARGPMGLEALTSYKWIIQGNGHIREG